MSSLSLISTKERTIRLHPSLPPILIRLILLRPSTSLIFILNFLEKPLFGSLSLSIWTKDKGASSTSLRTTNIHSISQQLSCLLAKRFARQCYVATPLEAEWTVEYMECILNTCIELVKEEQC
ncbi:hypothetical protein PNEG_03036 [Pneumocystis murina B123]|uniref:Uncharacterized protein n=1 Tax=Pneumocystis murina (strain B123) TaxID=1069680 RepID=M7P3W6_PNEMU|nr:hypothetical protein PNEG_03036 [Pneumocystis murina B123]EMR08555.1 hypothetical protein PNEG_03036 [Pneumocystis murina B123]